MRRLKAFNNHLYYTVYMDNNEVPTPNVSYCIEENEVHYMNKTLVEERYTITNVGVNSSEYMWYITLDRQIEEQNATNMRLEVYQNGNLSETMSVSLNNDTLWLSDGFTAGEYVLIFKFDSEGKVIASEPYSFRYTPIS